MCAKAPNVQICPETFVHDCSLTKSDSRFSNLSITLCSHFEKTNFKSPCYHILIKQVFNPCLVEPLFKLVRKGDELSTNLHMVVFSQC